MLGAALIALTVIVLLPVAYLLTGGVLSAVMGWAHTRHGEVAHEGSEFIDLNR